MQLQVVGLPNRFEGAVKPAFMDIGTSMQIKFDEILDYVNLTQLAEPGNPHFYVEFPDANEKLYHRVRR